MKKKYSSELSMLKDMFPDWTDTDLVFALEEADGDIPSTVEKITQGAVSQFAEVKKTKDRARSKVKEDTLAASSTGKDSSSSRARGRGGFDSTRGGRGRGSERGRGGHRGGRGGHTTTNGTGKEATEASIPTTESTAWENTAAADAANGSAGPAPVKAPAAVAESTKSAAPAVPAQKSWASMFAPKPAPAPVPKKAPVPQTAAAEPPAAATPQKDTTEAEVPAPAPEVPEPEAPAVLPHELPADRPDTSDGGEALDLTPSKDPLTEENVEHLPDTSVPPATLTAASTTGSLDPRNLTPLPQAQGARVPLGGYATSANRLAGTGVRSASFQRRVKEQQEAVVMPGHSAVDRAAVQFGSMGLNGEPGLDVDDEREDPETRQQPQHSPPSQPRASLPPAPRQPSDQPEAVQTAAVPTPKQAPGLPPASAQNQQQIQDPSLSQGAAHEQQSNQYNQYHRYGQQDLSAPGQQKQYDPFSHQGQQNHYDQYGQQHQQQQQPQSSFGGLSSAPSDYSSYYTSDHQQRGYNQYYGGSYAPQQDTRSQSSQNQPDAALGQQRSASGFGTGPNESAFGTQGQQQVSIRHLISGNSPFGVELRHDAAGAHVPVQPLPSTSGSMSPRSTQAVGAAIFRADSGLALSPSRKMLNHRASFPSLSAPSSQHIFIEYYSNKHPTQPQSRFDTHGPGSGNNTPNPVLGGQHQQNAPQSQHSMQQQGQHGGYGGAASGFPYGHQYYNSPYPQAYQNQFGFNGQPYYANQGNKGGYGANPYGGGLGYDSSSSAPGAPFGQGHQSANRAVSGSSALGGGLDDYNRGGSASQGFGSGINDSFQRSSSGFGAQGYGQQQNLGSGVQQESSADALKPFNTDANSAKPGPSPRPGSAVGSQQQSANLPPPQSQQHSGGFGSYQGFNQNYLGGLGGGQQSGQGGYGGQGQAGYNGYGGGFNQTYGQGYGSARGGWGQNYSQGH